MKFIDKAIIDNIEEAIKSYNTKENSLIVEILDDDYEVVERLMRGEFGLVYLKDFLFVFKERKTLLYMGRKVYDMYVVDSEDYPSEEDLI